MTRVGVIALAILVLCAGCQPGSSGASPSASAGASEPAPSPSTAASTASLPFPSVELPPDSAARLEQPVVDRFEVVEVIGPAPGA